MKRTTWSFIIEPLEDQQIKPILCRFLCLNSKVPTQYGVNIKPHIFSSLHGRLQIKILRTGYDKNTIEEHDSRQTLVRNIDQVLILHPRGQCSLWNIMWHYKNCAKPTNQFTQTSCPGIKTTHRKYVNNVFNRKISVMFILFALV